MENLLDPRWLIIWKWKSIVPHVECGDCAEHRRLRAAVTAMFRRIVNNINFQALESNCERHVIQLVPSPTWPVLASSLIHLHGNYQTTIAAEKNLHLVPLDMAWKLGSYLSAGRLWTRTWIGSVLLLVGIT